MPVTVRLADSIVTAAEVQSAIAGSDSSHLHLLDNRGDFSKAYHDWNHGLQGTQSHTVRPLRSGNCITVVKVMAAEMNPLGCHPMDLEVK